jgi:hypothetical protein
MQGKLKITPAQVNLVERDCQLLTIQVQLVCNARTNEAKVGTIQNFSRAAGDILSFSLAARGLRIHTRRAGELRTASYWRQKDYQLHDLFLDRLCRCRCDFFLDALENAKLESDLS